MPARGRDRLDDRLPLRPFELGELGLELLALRTRELLPALVGHLVAAAARAAAAPAAATAAARTTAPSRRRARRTTRTACATFAAEQSGQADLLLAADELFEVRLALHADVFVDRHRSEVLALPAEARSRETASAAALGGSRRRASATRGSPSSAVRLTATSATRSARRSGGERRRRQRVRAHARVACLGELRRELGDVRGGARDLERRLGRARERLADLPVALLGPQRLRRVAHGERRVVRVGVALGERRACARAARRPARRGRRPRRRVRPSRARRPRSRPRSRAPSRRPGAPRDRASSSSHSASVRSR